MLTFMHDRDRALMPSTVVLASYYAPDRLLATVRATTGW